ALWVKVQDNSSPEDFGAHLYPHFTKSCGFCDRNHDVSEPAFFSEYIGEIDIDHEDDDALSRASGSGGGGASRISIKKTPEKNETGFFAKLSGAGEKQPPGVAAPGNGSTSHGQTSSKGVAHVVNSGTPTARVTPDASSLPPSARRLSMPTGGKTPGGGKTVGGGKRGAEGSTAGGWKPTATDQELILGEQTWNMIHSLIGLVWEPETQQEKVYV
ncbi:hypothetical protein T484DRAFT_1806942, partial [Baffinella frigidus]